ncbi:hypothetical protein DPMN_096552 [Dreissena polymorpha]|uniref:Uncharacterized protein n=1 Tax=Dreissena polymorpha TaxID=45954 RepID=A0A9D4L9Z0_DREPO|nr:hypothetical protein DPMN_096552 [Dreissena polymorpha]
MRLGSKLTTPMLSPDMKTLYRKEVQQSSSLKLQGSLIKYFMLNIEGGTARQIEPQSLGLVTQDTGE